MSNTQINNGRNVLEKFLRHAGAPRTSTELHASDILKGQHPEHYVTAVHLKTIDLFGYAKDGHASCTVVDDVEHEFECSYEAPEFRLNATTEVGKLRDRVRFGFYQYEWSGTTFLVYRFEVPRLVHGPETFIYALAPRIEGQLDKGHNSTMDKLLIAAGLWTNQLHEEVYVFDTGNWIKSKSLYRSVHSSSWDDVILNPDMKELLMKDVLGFFDSKDLYQQFQVPWKRGLILHGLPGNGKTISLKALMSSLATRDIPIPSLYVKTFEGCNTQASQQHSIREIFNKARRTAPCLLIFEDLDSLITDKTRSYFLNEVDGIESNDGILMVGSTNHLEKLDPAIRDRPSRFDRKYFFRLPEINERASYARYWKKKLSSTQEVALPEDACEVIAQMTDGFSFAYLKELFITALLVVARGGTAEDAIDSAGVAGGVSSSTLSNTEGPSMYSTSTSNSSAQNTPTSSAADTDSKPLDEEAKAKAEAEAKAKAEKEAERALNASRKSVLSSMVLSGDLKDNVFVKVVRQQALTLLDEMDRDSEA